MARPSKYNEQISKAICDRLQTGSTRTAAAEAVEIDSKTFARWMKSNVLFCRAVTRAEAEAECRMAALLMNAAVNGEWRAAESWLKRRRRAEWGDTQEVEISGTGGGPIKITEVIVELPDEEEE